MAGWGKNEINGRDEVVMRKAISRILSGIIAAGLLAGCAGGSKSKPIADQEQRITSHSLPIAVRRGDLAGVRYHIKHNADVMATDSRGRTMLHLAVLTGKLEIVQYLVEHGADVNAKDAKGKTPLHIAESLKKTYISEYLIQKGADPKIRDRDGHVPGELKVSVIGNQMPTYSKSDNPENSGRNKKKVSKKKRNRRKIQIRESY